MDASRIELGLHYHRDCQVDRQARGTLTGFRAWTAATYPELDASWPSVAVARLRHDDPKPGRWTLYEPTGSNGWARAADGEDPLALLELLAGPA